MTLQHDIAIFLEKKAKAVMMQAYIVTETDNESSVVK